MNEGIYYNGYFYPKKDIDRAINDLSPIERMSIRQLMFWLPSNSIISLLESKGVLNKPYRENNQGWLLYPGFIAKDILEKVGMI